MIQPTNAQYPIPQSGANAVAINIYNPQAYGSAPSQAAVTAPYGYTNSLYNIPYNPVYAQTVPYTPQPSQVQDAGQQYYPQIQPQVVQPAVAAIPAPRLMPDSVIDAAPVAVQQQAPVEVEETQKANTSATKTVDTDALINDLKSTDPKVRESAINKLAEYAQDDDIDVTKQVITEPIMQTLVDIISEDTTGLEGPTEEQAAIADKISRGETLTPEEDKLAEDLSPRDAANQNRMYALYTLAMLQKFQRQEVDDYIASQKANGQDAIEPLKLQDVYGYEGVADVIKNDTRPEVKIAAIQALRYVADANDIDTVKTVLADALKSSDEEVKAAAEEAIETVEKL